MPTLPTGTVTFLFTDIEGSTRLWEQHPEAMKAALARHDLLLRQAIERHGGGVVKTTGDGVLAAFATVSGAVQAALEAQRALYQEAWPETGALRVRMALHTGTAEERGTDYFGPSLNRAARLMSAGHGGQILLSLATQILFRDALAEMAATHPGHSLQVRDLGEHRLKDLSEPERIFQLVTSDLPSDFPPLKTLNSRPNNIPPQPTALVGRERETKAVAELLLRPDVRLVTLTGPGGTGKTRLSVAVAAELLDHFPDGVYFVALAAISDADLVAAAIAQTLDVREVGGRPLLDTLKAYLREKHMLLVLDNFEQVTAAAPLVADLLAAAPRLEALVSSRAALRVYGEREFEVPPLGLPDLQHLPPVEQLTMYDAVRLFVERARDSKPDFQVTNENAPAVAEICARLDGLPLAIELAAARIRLLAPQAILARLSSRLKLLTGGARNLPGRQQTLRGAIDWSFHLLDLGEQMLFRRLGVFVGGFTLDAAEAVCNPTGDLEVDALDGIDSLVSKSLVRQTETASGESRLMMLETIREYAVERLAESEEAASLRGQHAHFFVTLAEEAEPQLKGPRQAEWLERLEVEHDNLRAALRRSSEDGDAETCLRLVVGLTWFWRLLGYFGEGRAWLERTLALPGAVDHPVLCARANFGLAMLAMLQGDLAAAERSAEAGRALLHERDHPRDLAFLLRALGMVQLFRGEGASGRAHLEEAVALFREVGDRWGLATVLMATGMMALRQGADASAKEQLEQGLALFREAGDNWFIASALNSLGDLARMQGDYPQATALYEESLALYQEMGSRRDAAASLHNLGFAALYSGAIERAGPLFEQSLALHRELGNKDGMIECVVAFAQVACERGQAERAALLLGAAEAAREATGVLVWPAGRAAYERTLTTVQDQLDEATLATTLEKGRAMRLEEAIAFALAEEG